MAENDKQFDAYKSQRRPDILRAKDIIPSRGPAGEGENTSQVDIPRFSLADDIMAEQRRLNAIRRKGPLMEDRKQSTEDRRPSPVISFPSFTQSYTLQWDPLIADIVARDIERFCSGGSWA